MWRYFYVAHISHDIFLKTPRDLAVLGFGTHTCRGSSCFFGGGFGRRYVRMMLDHRQTSYRCRFFTGEERQITLEYDLWHLANPLGRCTDDIKWYKHDTKKKTVQPSISLAALRAAQWMRQAESHSNGTINCCLYTARSPFGPTMHVWSFKIRSRNL